MGLGRTAREVADLQTNFPVFAPSHPTPSRLLSAPTRLARRQTQKFTLRALAKQMPSLLSLPDELLVRTFDYRAQRFGTCDNPLVPLLSVCRRVRNAAQSILYSEFILGSDADAMACFDAVVQQNPSVGQLVGRLTIRNTDSTLDRPRLQLSKATIRTFTQLKELTLHGAPFDEASAVLAALPSPPVRRLDLQLANIINLLQRQNLWNLTSRFSELRVFKIDTCDVPVDFDPSVTAPAAPKGALPRLVELHISDSFLSKILGAAELFRRFLPSLRYLHLMITQSNLMPAITAILSEPPSSFHDLEAAKQPRVRSPESVLPGLAGRPSSPPTRIEYLLRIRAAGVSRDGELGVDRVRVLHLGHQSPTSGTHRTSAPAATSPHPPRLHRRLKVGRDRTVLQAVRYRQPEHCCERGARGPRPELAGQRYGSRLASCARQCARQWHRGDRIGAQLRRLERRI